MKIGISIHMLTRVLLWTVVLAGPALGPQVCAAAGNDSIVISEIMYHPYHPVSGSEDLKQEWIELFNRGTQPVDLTGWRFSDGVDFVFSKVTLGVGQYLVVAADANTFTAHHPGVTNVVGGWIGSLSNSGERLQLADPTGAVVDTVPYADQGDWGTRELGPAEVDNGGRPHRGWDWTSPCDGAGKSLELINPALPNEFGGNWAPSLVDGGTPGQANSVAAADAAPIIAEVQHWPAIPKPTNTVTVTARVIDEQTAGLVVTLHYRLDTSNYVDQNSYPKFVASTYTSVPMADDGTHGDGRAGDGVFGATIPAQANGRIVEFYVEARDAGAKTRTWPAPALVDGVPQQVTNALYQVDSTFSPEWVAGSQPVYYVIMTEMERAHLAYIVSHSAVAHRPNSEMNATFISVDGTGIQVVHNAAIRDRGHGSRAYTPYQCHVNFPHDRSWNGVTETNLNTNYTYVEILGCAVFRRAGIGQQNAYPVKVRLNGRDWTSSNMTRTSGSYDCIEAVDSDWAKRHYPDDSEGNLYKCMHTDNPNIPADFRYLGTNGASYAPYYIKKSNASANDWSDLVELIRVLSDTASPDNVYAEQVRRVLNTEQWLREIAVNILADNCESTLAIGTGDEYFLYRGTKDTRFVLAQHDLEAMFGQGDERTPSVSHSIWQATSIAAMNRFMKHPQFAPRYFWHLKNLADTTFAESQFNPLVDYLLGSWVPADRVAAMKRFIADRRAYVLSVIPQKIRVTSTPGEQGGYSRTGAGVVSLSGEANAIETRQVLVNGRPAAWSAWQGTWSIDNLVLSPGLNRVVIQTLDAAGREFERAGVDILSDTGLLTAKVGTLGADEVWTAAGGPYHVTGSITIPAGRTLTIEPGTTVFVDAKCGFTVHGRLVARGTEYQRIRFTRMPGTTAEWAGFQIPDSKEDNVIAYADLEYGGSRSQWITTGNNNGSVVGPTARLTIDHATFSGSDTQYFSIWDPQIIIRNSVFADLGTHYMCMAERMPADGWFLIEGNLFGLTHGDTDILHLNSVSVKGGPVAQIIDNVFTGGGDDLVDDNETDTYIEGNLFMHANVGNTARSASAAVTTGPGGGSASANNLDTQQLTIVRNIFYHNDYGVLCKTGGSALIYGNVFLQNAGALLFDEPTRNDSGPGRAAYVDSCIFWDSGPEVNGTATDNGTGTFVNRQQTQLVVNNSIVGSQFTSLGMGNIDADPVFVDAARDVHVDANLPCFSTGFPGFAAGGYLLKGMVPDVHLRPESAARGAGANDVDMGALTPSGATISGEPAPATWRMNATLTVGGPDLVAYKYRVNDGPWSTEVLRPGANAGSVSPSPLPPIALTNLQNGQSYTVSVLGKNAAGVWQREDTPTVSRAWTVDTAHRGLVINEVLAVNRSLAQYGTAFPDLVELYYDGPAALSLSGMSLSDDPTQPAQFVFPADATIHPGQYLVLYADTGASDAGLHLGFALNAEGDALYLYDRTGELIDSVVFGQQLPDLSIGRVGPQGQWHLTTPTLGQANVAYPLGDSRTVKINEWLADSDVLFASDFIELYNPNPDPVDLGGLYLTDNPQTQPHKHAIRPLSFLAGAGYGVFWANNTNDPGCVPFHLSADGEMIGLLDAQANVVDQILYVPQTTDFSEGRAPDGSVKIAVLPLPTPGLENPAAQTTASDALTLVAEGAPKRVLVPTAAVDNAWRSDSAFNDSTWISGSGGVGYERSTGYERLFSINVQSQMYSKNGTCYIRVPFTVTADVLQGLTSLTLAARCDDGFVAYLNGVEVQRLNFTGTPAWNSTATTSCSDSDAVNLQSFDLSNQIGALHAGTNLLALQALNDSTTSSDFLLSVVLEGGLVQTTPGLNVDGALRLLDGLRITELMYRAPKSGNYDYVELKNILNVPLDVTGVRFDKGIDFTFPSLILQPGEYVVVAANVAAFQSMYGTTAKVVGQYKGNLNDTGEKIVLLLPAPFEAAILRFEYSNTWYPATDGGGKSLTVQDPTAPPAAWKDAESWQAADPTPGRP